MQRINTQEIKKTMNDAEIQLVSIASGSSKENILPKQIPNDENEHNSSFTKDTVFGAASLSKPVFAYLILKLIRQGVIKLDTNLNEAIKKDEETNQEKRILSFAGFCERVGINWIDSKENQNRANQFTPELILTHQTGLPIGYNDAPKPEYDGKPAPLIFDFEPGNGYGYSGLHLMYLQQWVEEKTGRKLEDLAREYVFDPADMSKNTTFNTPKANAANSLHTTAEDYARFCIHWMNDNDPLVQEAFKSKVSLTDDPWAVREHVSKNTLQHLAWGYGWGLEKNDMGEVICAFHTGDMGEWRAGVKLDLVSKNAMVYFSKSSYENGHLLQEQIFGQSHALDYFFDKFKFARTVEELKSDWKENRSYGIRKEPVKSTQIEDVNHETSRRNSQSRYSEIEKKIVMSETSTTSTEKTQLQSVEKTETSYSSPSDKLRSPFQTKHNK